MRLSPVGAGSGAFWPSSLAASAAGFPKGNALEAAKGAALGFSWKDIGALAGASDLGAAAAEGAPKEENGFDAAAEDAGCEAAAPAPRDTGPLNAAAPNECGAADAGALAPAGASEADAVVGPSAVCAAAAGLLSSDTAPNMEALGFGAGNVLAVVAASKEPAEKEKFRGAPPKEKPTLGGGASSALAFFGSAHTGPSATDTCR